MDGLGLSKSLTIWLKKGGRVQDLKITAPDGSKLYEFLHGNGWSARYARKSLPVLVRWVEEENANHSAGAQEYTYKDLAVVLGNANNAHPIHFALGVLGDALRELQKLVPDLRAEKIPPIQLIVWTKGAHRPGDDAYWFVGIEKKQVKNLSEEALRSIAADVRQQIIAYPDWRKILKLLRLKPLTIDLPEIDKVTSDPTFCGGGYGGGESEAHRRLKYYVAENYSKIGLKGKYEARVEELLLSGDEIDVFLENQSEQSLVGVEVKSQISCEADLIRGIFQCVKYCAVLSATEDYAAARATTWVPRQIKIIFVTEKRLPTAVEDLAKLLGVPHILAKVPDTYVAPKKGTASAVA